jgi:RimJ/RimL family protein N-acetyltransferase
LYAKPTYQAVAVRPTEFLKSYAGGVTAPAARLTYRNLVLEPLSPGHVEALFSLLAYPAVYEFIGGQPESVEALRSRVTAQARGWSADGSEQWLNWVVVADGDPVGTVQATIRGGPDEGRAEVAWVISPGYQGRGYATAAAALLVEWLREQGVVGVMAHIHPDHVASQAVARSLGLRPTAVVLDGETRWE